ncbi:50S ribosomal protein L10 [Treponema parvum]|uniref:Large ribosomal subunit protein uL10 n=1 Tax=Treponema parvum TaxID=138851 RepID=A0A975F1A9_9SPIR|nr:50S ribosomal protein L10 [Treponema parvum]QTQ12533.1 50S ribosomal protein L10 [Treponema parvum]
MAMRAKKVQPAKTEAIESAKKTFEGYNDFIFTDYRGLTVEQISALRGKLREKDSQFKVVKNNFAKIAFDSLKIENVSEFLKGPTAIAMAKEDSNDIAKVLFDFAKEVPALSVKAGYIGKEIYDVAKMEAYSKIPGKKELIAMLMSAINGPARKLAATLKAYAEKKEKDGGAAVEAAKSGAPEETAGAAPSEAAASKAEPAENAAPAAEAPKAEGAAPAAETAAT